MFGFLDSFIKCEKKALTAPCLFVYCLCVRPGNKKRRIQSDKYLRDFPPLKPRSFEKAALDVESGKLL